MKLYGTPLSGHTHRVRLFLSLLKLPYEFVQIDMKAGQNRSPEHLARSPFGEVPVLEDGDVVLPDSTAILVYLASKYDDSGRWRRPRCSAGCPTRRARSPTVPARRGW
jgi:glutathione S-transferase